MARYEARPIGDGLYWAVYETGANEIAIVGGLALEGLSMEQADDLAGLLNAIEAVDKLARSTSDWPEHNGIRCTRPYDICPDDDDIMWIVLDVRTGEPACFNDIICTGLALDEAANLAELLNQLETEKIQGRGH